MLAANVEQSGISYFKREHTALYNSKFAKSINWENFYLYFKGILIFFIYGFTGPYSTFRTLYEFISLTKYNVHPEHQQ